MPLAERDPLLGEQPPFSPTLPTPPAPVAKHQILLEASVAWLSRRRVLVPLSLLALIGGSTYLAYQTQVSDTTADPAVTAIGSPDTDPQALAAPGVSSSTATSAPVGPTAEALAEAALGDLSPGATSTVPRTERGIPPMQTTSTTQAAPKPSSTAATTSATTATTATTDTSDTPSSTSLTSDSIAPPAPSSTPTTAAPPIPGPNELSDGGFERPAVASEFKIVTPQGWLSSTRQVEIWVDGFLGTAASSGRQFAELNVHRPTTISQQLTVTPGATYEWSLAHRGRDDRDTVNVLLDGALLASVSSEPDGWNRPSGTVTIGPNTTSIRFAIQAVDGGSSGNLVDDIVFRRVANP